MLEKLELEPFPFCIKGPRSQLAQGSQQSEQNRGKNASTKFKINCRHSPTGKCRFDIPNGLGDVPLIALARADMSSRGEYSFAPPARTVGVALGPDGGYKRSDAAKMVELLIQSGVNVGQVNAALDVNALEAALDPFLGGQLYDSEIETWSAQREIVALLLEAMERTGQGTLRDDYRDAVGNFAADTEVRQKTGTLPVRLLPSEMIARILALPRRSQILVCGAPDRFGFETWFQSPPNRRISYVSPLRFAP